MAKDSTLALRILSVRFIQKDQFDEKLLKKAYVRVLIDDDTYTTTFPRISVMDLSESDEQDDEEEEED